MSKHVNPCRPAGAQLPRVAVFAGTTEGRLFVERLVAAGVEVEAFVATAYGSSLLEEGPRLHIHMGRLDVDGMTACLAGVDVVVDATHPFATQAHETIRAACAASAIPRIRLARGREGRATGAVYVDSVEEAAFYLKDRGGSILLTTGSKDVDRFLDVPGMAERTYIRVLPQAEILNLLMRRGVAPSHIIAMQGPFSTELNSAMLRHVGASWLVTKESGREGGLDEKIAAANMAHAGVVIVARPDEEPGARNLEEAYAEVLRIVGRCAR